MAPPRQPPSPPRAQKPHSRGGNDATEIRPPHTRPRGDADEGVSTDPGVPAVGAPEEVSAWDAPPGKPSGEQEAAPYQTGSAYPAEDAPQDALDPLEPPAFDEDPSKPVPARNLRNETRIAPLESLDGRDEGEDADPLPEPGPDEDDSPDATRAGPPVKLQVIAGPDEGKLKRFNGVRMVVGRMPGCDFTLSDGSISRRHLELVQGDKGVLLRDLGSGNGAKVNDVKVDEKLLVDGDEIAIGKTRFRFVDESVALSKLREEKGPADPPAPAPAARDPEEARATSVKIAVPGPPPRRGPRPDPGTAPNPLRWVLIGGGALLLVVIMALTLRRPPGPPPPDPRQVVADEKMQKARIAIHEEKYEDAVRWITEAEKARPGVDSDHVRERAAHELEAEQGLARLKVLLSQSQYDAAKALLSQLPEPASPRLTALRDQLAQELDAKATAALEAELDAALAARDLGKARALVAKLSPDRARQAQPKLQEAEAAAVEAEKAEELRRGHARVEEHHRAKAQRAAEIDEAFLAVARRFHGGEFARAILECDRVVEQHRGDAEIRQRAAELKKLIPYFQRNFDDGQKKYKANHLESAVAPLRRAREAYGKIGFAGALGGILDDELAAASLSGAGNAIARGDLGSAAADYRAALQLNPGDENAKAGLDRVAAKASELFQEAYIIRDRDPREARAKFKVVLQVAAPNSALHERAQVQLNALGSP